MDLIDFTVNSENRIIDAMKVIDRGEIGIAIVLDSEGGVCGLLSNGDIRKAVAKGADVNEQRVREIMRNDPILLSETHLNDEIIVNTTASRLFERSPRGGFIPVVDGERKLVNLLHIFGFQKEDFSNLRMNGKENFSVKEFGSVLIVGGAGYLGSTLARKLLKKGYLVRILDLFMFGRDSIKEIENHPHLEIVNGDVRNISTVSSALKGIDAVIHLAAFVGDPACKSYPLDTIETNYLATRALAEACKYHQINRFIFASSCSVYGKGDGILTEEAPVLPLSLYARSKIKSEEGILNLTDGNFSPCIMRMATLYGLSPRMRFDLVVNVLSMKAVTEKKITIFGGDQWRPLLHVDDAAEAYIKCLEAPIEEISGKIFNVGSSEQNYQIMEIGTLVKRIVPETEVITTEKEIVQGQLDKRDYNVSFERIRKILNFFPKKTLEEGITEIKRVIETGGIHDVKNKKYYNLVQNE